MARPPDAFLSYTHFDDEYHSGAISKFREELSRAVRAMSGRPIEIYQDVEGIGLGQPWQEALDKAIAEVAFFIPIVTPNFFESDPCRKELHDFLKLQEYTPYLDRVLPIYWRTSRVLEEEEELSKDLLAQQLKSRQWSDWRGLSDQPFSDPVVRKALEALALKIDEARRRSREHQAEVARAAAEAAAREAEQAALRRQEEEENVRRAETAETKRRAEQEAEKRTAEERAKRQEEDAARERAEKIEAKRLFEEGDRIRAKRAPSGPWARANRPTPLPVTASEGSSDESPVDHTAPRLKYDAIILYSWKDLELARKLKQLLVQRNVSCWFADEDLELGEGIQTGISRALAQSVFALICIGKHGLGAFQQGEWNTVYTAAQAGKILAIPIYLGEDSPIGPNTVEDLFLAGLKSYDLRQRLDGNPQLEVLITSLVGTPGAAGANLAEYARTRGINIFVGPTWPDRVLPCAWDVALDMLEELQPVTDNERDALSRAPLMRPEEASLAIALRDGQMDDGLDRIVRRFIAPRSLGEPQAYAGIVQIAQELVKADRPNARAIVFTTNVDLSLERAFLRQGVAFTRLVYDLDHRGFWETAYEAAVSDQDGRLMLRRGDESFVESLEGDLTQEQLRLFHLEFERLAAKANISFADFVRVIERNKMIAGYHEAFHAPEISPLDTLPGGPVLVKLLGTHRVRRTCVISYDRFFQLAGVQGILPPALSGALLESASLLVGYDLLEPAFWLLFERILRQPFAEAWHDRRYAVLRPLRAEANGWDELAGVVGSAIAGSYHNGLQMQIVAHANPAELLADLRQQLAQHSDDPWESW